MITEELMQDALRLQRIRLGEQYDLLASQLEEIREKVRPELEKLERIRKLLSASNQQLLLSYGEMTAQELRTVRAIFDDLLRKIALK